MASKTFSGQLTDNRTFESIDVRRIVSADLARDGFTFVDGSSARSLLARDGGLSDWRQFANSWSDLPIDKYMADSGTYRRRRYCVFSTCSASDEFQLDPPSLHFQSLAFNTSNGGIERWYEPFSTEITNGASLGTILNEARTVFEKLSSNRIWHVEAHQFRIEVFADELGKPTPEGIHRDGVEFGLVMMINRTNVLHGETTIYRNGYGNPIGQSTLRQPLECLFFVDTKVRHAVSSIIVKNPSHRGTRDVLVVTFSNEQR
jgi:hypothetical protein